MSNNEQKIQSLLNEIDLTKTPQHVAIIMDGNGRWAKKKGLPRAAGHHSGVKSLKKIVIACKDLNIKYLTVYAFSTENWKRPQEEVSYLMKLLVNALKTEIKELHENKVKIKAIGRLEYLPEASQKAIKGAEKLTKDNEALTLVIALNYGGRAEIVDAVKKMLPDLQTGKMNINNLDETIFSEYLYNSEIPDPDLVIRTAGESRLSNFLLWQIAYSEFYITPVLWPDFDKNNLIEAIHNYQKRERRFGGINNK